MKKKINILGFIAIMAVIGFFMVSCDDGSHICSFDSWVITTPANCTTEGIETGTCIRNDCNQTSTRNISALGHNFGNSVVTTPANCTTAGIETGTCTRNDCNQTTTQSIAALGHNFSGWIVTTPASCTAGVETGTCARVNCNETSTRSITALGHNFSGWVVTTPASCTEGIETGTCTRENCNETGTRSIALGHNFGGWVITTLPTVSTPGQERRTCQRINCFYFETRSVSYSAPPTITIQNNTGYSIGSVYIKPSTSTNWDDNSWTYISFSNGTSRTFTLSLPLSTANVYDIRLARGSTSGNENFRKYRVSISNNMTVTFTSSDMDDGSNLPSITIQNRSGVTFNSLHIKPSSSSNWDTRNYGSISNNSDSTVGIPIPSSSYTVFDIQVRSTNPANTYTRNNVTISNGMILTFTSADSDNPLTTNPIIVIQNNTGYSIGSVYIKPSTSTNWDDNSWTYLSFSNGTSRTFSLSQPLSTTNVYDIRLARGSTGGNENFRKYKFTITDGMIITMTVSDMDDGSNLPSITIQNRSGVTFNSLHIKPSSSSNWDTRNYGSISNNSDSTVGIPIPSSSYTVFDIQVRSTNPANTYTRNNVTISNGMILTFTRADSDNPLTGSPIIVIQNNTGYSIGSVYIKPSTSTNWEISSTYQSFSNGTSRTFTLSQSLSTVNVYDIRLARGSTGGNENFIKTNIMVTDGMIVILTNSDLQ